jgi:hypothetical protein
MYRNSDALYSDLARRMRALAVPLDMGAFAEAVVVRQEGGWFANSAALSYLTSTLLGTVITVYLKFTGNRAIPFALSGVELCLPWKNTPASLLQDPADSNAPAIYKLAVDPEPIPGEIRHGTDITAKLTIV